MKSILWHKNKWMHIKRIWKWIHWYLALLFRIIPIYDNMINIDLLFEPVGVSGCKGVRSGCMWMCLSVFMPLTVNHYFKNQDWFARVHQHEMTATFWIPFSIRSSASSSNRKYISAAYIRCENICALQCRFDKKKKPK